MVRAKRGNRLEAFRSNLAQIFTFLLLPLFAHLFVLLQQLALAEPTQLQTTNTQYASRKLRTQPSDQKLAKFAVFEWPEVGAQPGR